MAAKRTDQKRILVVDDHPVFRDGLARLIEQEGDLSVCGTTDNASDAMRMVETMKPDLVSVDISLTGKNGIELLKTVKAMHPELKALVFSMHDEALYAERALRAGALGYVMKGAPVEVVIGAIRRVLAGDIYLSESMSDSLLKISINGAPGLASPLRSLSDRQLEVLELFGRGNSSKVIAEKLKLSVKTVEVHRQNIKQKLGLGSALEFMRYAVRWVEQN
ncbi:MAG TPA: response regulator transcription factor [Chthoniobacteraceae bacterium]|nr:response regulator transcription factor [Chthoniobacteraceae bacterium]